MTNRMSNRNRCSRNSCHSPGQHRRAGVGLAALVVLASLLVGGPGRAETDPGADAVVVVPTGPATDATILGLDTTAEPARVRHRGRRRLVAPALGPAAVRDLKILPDDTNLLADVNGRGAVITRADGAIDYALSAAGERPRVTSASVTAYGASGQPTRLLVTDSNRSQALVFDLTDDQLDWADSFVLPGARASFAQAVALPGNHVAVAINWPSLALSAIDIYDALAGTPVDKRRRLANAAHPDEPAETVIVAELAHLRDLAGLPNGHLLVTTTTKLAEIGIDGTLAWSVDIRQSEALNGQFGAATPLASGRVAVATLEPGVWTSSHTNHRVHWLNKSALADGRIEIVASSDALSAAPAAVEPAAGDGGSGSFGYQPGIDGADSAGLAALALSQPLSLNRDTYRLGQFIQASATLQNTGDTALVATRVAIVLTSGACGAQNGTAITVAETTALELAANQTYRLHDARAVDRDLPAGRWCAAVRAQSPDGDAVDVGAPVGIDILNAGPADTGSTVVVADVGVHQVDANRADSSVTLDDQPDDPGCGCSQRRPGLPGSWLAAAAVALVGWWRRRQ